MELLIILGLILLNGMFSMAEMSLVSVRKYKLEMASNKGSSAARTALALSHNPTKFLSTVQIGITLIGILVGVYSGESYSMALANYIEQNVWLKPYAHKISIIIIVVVVTYVTIVLGELIPKRLGLEFPESIAIVLAKPMYVLSLIASPFVWLLGVSNDIILRIIGIKSKDVQNVSEEEIKFIVKESAKGGEIQKVEQDIVERVFELGDLRINSLLTPRSDVAFLDISDDLETLKSKIYLAKHSVYPVCRNSNLDDVLGVVSLKDLFAAETLAQFDLKSFVKAPLFVNEKIYAYRILELFKREKTHYAIVVDEYGSTKGVVTMDDVLDALVGDVSDKPESEYQLFKRNDTSWHVDGQYSVFEFMKYFNLEMDENYENQYVTVAGLFIYKFTRIPDVGDKMTLNGYELEVVDKDGQRIDKILVTKLN